MGMTIAEKIIAAAAGVDSVKPGDIYTVQLDHLMSNDGTTHLTVDMYNNKLKNPHIADTKKLVFIVDHNVPSDSPKTAASQKKMRDFARENNIDFWEGKGVCHQIMIENYVRPGQLIFGADSHTCSYGALGAFGTGVGCTDFLYGMVTGTSWVMVPETVKFNLTGKLPEGVYARDLILTIIGEIGANGCNYQAMEFTGEGAKTLSISDRMALCNMAVEAGAKTGIFEADDKALEYLKEHGREPKAVYHSDPDAVYAREYTFDLSKVRPVVAKPDFVDNLVPAEEVRGVKIDMTGVDLVLELPYPWCCGSAEYFASGAVSLLAALGVDALCFGSESGDAASLTETARRLESDLFRDALAAARLRQNTAESDLLLRRRIYREQ